MAGVICWRKASARPVLSSTSSAASSPEYITASVLTTSSLAPTPEMIPTLMRQSKFIGANTGLTARPKRSRYEASGSAAESSAAKASVVAVAAGVSVRGK